MSFPYYLYNLGEGGPSEFWELPEICEFFFCFLSLKEPPFRTFSVLSSFHSGQKASIQRKLPFGTVTPWLQSSYITFLGSEVLRHYRTGSCFVIPFLSFCHGGIMETTASHVAIIAKWEEQVPSGSTCALRSCWSTLSKTQTDLHASVVCSTSFSGLGLVVNHDCSWLSEKTMTYSLQ